MQPSGQPMHGQAELILRELDSLPTLAAAATRLLSITSADDADLQEVIRLIETDPAMTAKVLSLCARAALGISQPVTTVSRAVVLLGLETVRTAVLSVQVVDWMRRVGGPRDDRPRMAEATHLGFDAQGFWRHSIAVACAAELICREHSGLQVKPGEAFVAGLVHDLGKPALAIALPRAYTNVVELAAQRQGNIADFERQILGLDHHTAGKRLAERWGLPEVFRNAIWLHGQRPEMVPEGSNRSLVGIVSAADALCRRLHLGWSGNFTLAQDLRDLCAGARLNETKVESIVPSLAQELSRRCEDLGLGSEPGDRVLLESVLAANRQLGRLNRAMEDRSRAADRRLRVLTAIAEFERLASTNDPDAGPLEMMECVVASAAALFGPGAYCIVAQPRDPGPWLLLGFTPDGSPAGHEWLEPPKDAGGGPASLSGLTAILGAAGTQAGGGTVGLQSWLAGRLRPVVGTNGGELRMITLRPATAAGTDGGVPGILVHDRAQPQQELQRELPPLIATWSVAVAGAAAHARTRALSERLAESNRELAEMQQKLADVQSMARLGELTSGAAHEMNNPLAVISARGQALAARLSDAGDRAAADAIVVAANRLSDLVTQLHMIAIPPEYRPEPTSLQDLLSLVVRDAKERTGARAVRTPVAPVKVVVAAPVPPVRADPALLRRAILELVVNAIEAGPREPVEVRIEPDEDGRVLRVRVIDSGLGMSAHALQHAFDPFFSEKPAGRQAGLGLPTARRLIELHGGSIVLESRKDEGTTATIELRNWRWTQPEGVAATPETGAESLRKAA